MDRRSLVSATLGAFAACAGPRAASAQEGDPALRIGVQTETSSLDPHFALIGANQAIAAHVFDALVGSDITLQPAPGLTTVSNPQPDVWEFRVRDGATFQDGTPVTAEALRFSLDRMPRVPKHRAHLRA